MESTVALREGFFIFRQRASWFNGAFPSVLCSVISLNCSGEKRKDNLHMHACSSYTNSIPVTRVPLSRKQRISTRAMPSETETEPESNNDNGNKQFKDGELPPPLDPFQQNNRGPSPPPSIGETQPTDMDLLKSSEPGEETSEEVNDQATIQDMNETSEVASGSPLPGLKPPGELIRIPKASIDILKDQVFGFDTFFITSQEPYEGGVLFKGNLRGLAARSYEKITKRMQDRFGDQYKLFILANPEDDKPVAVVVPKETLQPETTAVPEWFAAGAFGLVTIFTLLLRNVPGLQSNLLSTFDNLQLLKDGLPGALITAGVLAAHELGHLLVAKYVGAKLGVPYFVPSWQIGSFGAITRIISIMSKREDLVKIAAAGPLAGFSIGFLILLLGFVLPPSDGFGIVVDATVFHDSFLVGGIAKLLLGDVLKEASLQGS
ncbi:probable zinc metalloprotease EGY2, chloroplastic isoform X5 [Amborella trichopoda]|uniref:probable zinc metalloprotease EGY2, chloroplastic isoform X5 n=1 Tax=Amborella trichopoda TaxID=13333 RepID=UPI0005D383A3|nr:probable zinc metalloprotease EGY2, chloroplastic isoform X5 [Amborella trichopoda]|eukprot:XP_011624748.1 probable zinc metalloprotease EGY2, chloroplastic isoform X5 [Amborella trichopoda]